VFHLPVRKWCCKQHLSRFWKEEYRVLQLWWKRILQCKKSKSRISKQTVDTLGTEQTDTNTLLESVICGRQSQRLGHFKTYLIVVHFILSHWLCAHGWQCRDAKRILLASPPADWRRQPSCPRITQLSTVQQDLRHYKLHYPKQQIWLRTTLGLGGGWRRCMALRNLRVACQKRRLTLYGISIRESWFFKLRKCKTNLDGASLHVEIRQ